jgi:hypothetical protein
MADGNGNGIGAPTPDLTLTLGLVISTRTVLFNPSAMDEMMLLYMLDKARDAVKEYFAKQREGQRIVPAASMSMIQH